MRARRLAWALAAVALAPACSTSDDPGDGTNTAAITPATPNGLWELATLCDGNITRHKAVRQQELAGGIVRWQCGDRPGVDGEADRGQEYCEYFAVSDGRRVNRLAEADATKPLVCFFSSVFQDAELDLAGTSDEQLAASLAEPPNLGATFPVDSVRMSATFNSRNAATSLVRDGAKLVEQNGTAEDRSYRRLAACWVAATHVHDAAKAGALKAACSVDLSSDAAWAKAMAASAKMLTAADGEAYDEQQDMLACLSVRRLENGGVQWRMSDPHITQVTVRATEECACRYAELPRELQGFPMGTWSNEEQLPSGCRRATVGGKGYPLLTLCEVTEAERGDLALDLDHSDNLQAFCNERFGKDLVLTAPLRAVERSGSCKAGGGAFCAAFSKGAR